MEIIMSEPVFLYVEDDVTSREVMEMLLMYSLGYSNYTILPDSEGFMSKLQALAKKPDVIFLDIHMQPHNGFELLSMLRSHPKYRDTTVIALTASVMNEEVKQLETAGFDGAIAKPIKQDVFPQLVQQILQGERIWYIV
jgi:CheY-like chemotaxis protein